ncbi:MAG: prolyl oligopeptidase family serine peptidase [Pseudomonadota bacterium]
MHSPTDQRPTSPSTARVLALLGLLATTSLAVAQSPEAIRFAQDAEFSDVALSPNGDVIAYTRRIEDKRVVGILSLAEGKPKYFDTTSDKLWGYRFYDDDHLVLFKSMTTSFSGYRGEYEFRAAISTNWRTAKTTQLLRTTRGLLYPQLNLSTIHSTGAKGSTVLMSAYAGANQDSAPYDLFRIDLDSNRSTRLAKGTHDTIDWFVDRSEEPYARERFSDRKNLHTIEARRGKRWETIFEEETEIRRVGVVALSPDRKALVIVDEDESGLSDAVYHLSLADGSRSKPLFGRDDAQIASVLQRDGVAYGVRYTGLRPSYAFYDEAMTQDIARLLVTYPDSSVRILDISDDANKVLVRIEGNDTPGMFTLFDRTTSSLKVVTYARPDMQADEIGKIATLTVTARDGLSIPVIATYPAGIAPGSAEATALPTIMLPHGGPTAHDQVGFDETAQFFAHKGYLVLQPNFRGSTGFGNAHLLAGYGRWGREMQDDVTDTLEHFVDTGVTDPDRVCIAGYSYGGYSALAGGAFTPELYRCIIAIAGVADLPRMLSAEARQYGRNHWVVAYWNEVIGDSKAEKEKLKEISPANYAERFQAPVRLIHGDDDTIVPLAQSQLMRRRLDKAGKSVEFVRLKGEDHWLRSSPTTRVQSFQAMGEFVDRYLKEGS